MSLLLRGLSPIITPEIYPTARAFFQELAEQNRQTLKQKKLPPPDFTLSGKNALLDLIVLPRLWFFAMMNAKICGWNDFQGKRTHHDL